MPEGHVIHRLADEISRRFVGRGPVRVTSPQGRFAREASLIDARPITAAHARGKHRFVEFDDESGAGDPRHIVYIHLGLIGSLRFEDPDEVWGQIRLRMEVDEVAANLRGPQWCRLITDEEFEAACAKIGFDPILGGPAPEGLWEKVHRSRRPVGSLLMDQKLYAGVGNIYRAEALFRQGISPYLPGRLLQRSDFDRIWDDLVELMADGVKTGRIDTVRPEHTPEAMGRPPRKDDHGGEVYVYRRAGLPCFVCGTPIERAEMEGRNLFWCPGCQPGCHGDLASR